MLNRGKRAKGQKGKTSKGQKGKRAKEQKDKRAKIRAKPQTNRMPKKGQKMPGKKFTFVNVSSFSYFLQHTF